MSASSIARWNAIPLERSTLKSTESNVDDNASGDEAPEEKPQYLRDLEGGEASDDDVSLISRTPSPKPVDPMDVVAFEQHYSGGAAERVTVDTKIKSSNKGFALLLKMGWTEGSGLGLSDDARVEPVPFVLKADSTGIGKAALDARVIEATVAQRRDLHSERLLKESEEQRKTREVTVAQKQNIKAEIAQTLRPFYCDVCDKQYTNVAQFDEHRNSYAHAHKKRFKDMQDAERLKKAQSGEVDARKEKERKREEKELRKMAKAAGIALPVASSAPLPSVPLAPTIDKPSGGFKKLGWAAVSSSTSSTGSVPSAESGQQAESTSGFKKSGWMTLSSTSDDVPASNSPTPTPGFKKGGWATVAAAASEPVSTMPSPRETKTGWSALPATEQAAPLAKPGFKKIGFSASIGTTLPPSTTEASTASGFKENSAGAAITTQQPSQPTADSSQAPKAVAPAAVPQKQRIAERGRSNWASFQRGAVSSAAAVPESVKPVAPPPSRAPAPALQSASTRGRSRSNGVSRSRSRSRSPHRRRSHSRSRSRSRSRSPGSRSRSPPRRHRLPSLSTRSSRDDRDYHRQDNRRERDDGRYRSYGYDRRR